MKRGGKKEEHENEEGRRGGDDPNLRVEGGAFPANKGQKSTSGGEEEEGGKIAKEGNVRRQGV